jgi:hypothetical protein
MLVVRALLSAGSHGQGLLRVRACAPLLAIERPRMQDLVGGMGCRSCGAARWQHFLRRPPQVGRGRATSGASHLHKQQWSKRCWSTRGGGTLDIDGVRRVRAAPPWPRADSLATGRWVAALDTPCRSLRRPLEELRAASLTSSRQCCNCVLDVF